MPNTTPDIFLSQIEMTPTGGQTYNEFYWLNTNNALLTMTNVNFPSTGTYRFDISAYAQAGNPNLAIKIDGVTVCNIHATTTTIGIFSALSSTITAGNHTLVIQLTNFNSAANYCRVGLIYATLSTSSTPYTYPPIIPIPLIPGVTPLLANHFSSKHLRGFNLGSNGTNQVGETIQSMTDMKATGANIVRCFVEIYRPSSVCEGGGSTANIYQFKSGELTKLATTVSRASALGFYVVPVLFLDPCYNTDYWGNSARKASIISLWQQLATIYVGNPVIGAYDLINEPRSNYNYHEVIQFQSDIIAAIRTIDPDHVCMVECISNNMFAMMLPLNYDNIVYSPHGYSTLHITHQGVAGAGENTINKYPTITSTANLTAPWNITQLSAQHDDVRTMAHRFNVPIFIGEFSCINWAPLNDSGEWTSTKWVNDNISLLETENWSWAYHAWRGDYAGWEPEIPSSYYNQFTFSNAAPQGLPSYNTWVSNRTGSAPTIVMLEGWFQNNLPSTQSLYGTWGNSLIVNVPQYNQLVDSGSITGFNFRFPWRIIETSPGIFDWDTFDNQFNYALSSSIKIGFMMWSGPDSPIISPSTWLAQAPYNVPTFTNSRGTYPYYFNANYITRFYNMLDKTLAHLETYPQWKKDAILFWMSAEGSTGDEGPYKGTVPTTPFDFTISDDDWSNFKRDVWTYMYNGIASSSLSGSRLMINPSDDGTNFDFAIENIPTAWIKAGSFSHTYSNYGDLYYMDRFVTCSTFPTRDKRSRGEFEFTGENSAANDAWWGQSARQNYFALVCNALHAGLDTINIAATTAITYNYLSDPYALDFYTKYAGIRHASESNEGFCAFREVIDLNDTVRFPTSSYGAVVTQNVSEYNGNVNLINNSSDPITKKYYRLSNLLIRLNTTSSYRYLNPARIGLITGSFPGSSYAIASVDDQSDDKYNQDYGVNLIPGNWCKFIQEINTYNNSKGVWRVGPTESYFGRYARSSDYATNKVERYFSVDSGLAGDTPNSGSNATISIVYFDTGSAIWSVNASTLKGKEEVIVVQNTSTNTWMSRSITFDGFMFGGNLTSGSDITIRLHSPNQNYITTLLEFKNNSKII